MACQLCRGAMEVVDRSWEDCGCALSKFARSSGFTAAWDLRISGRPVPVSEKAAEVTEVKGTSPRPNKGTRLYAPRGECAYCDARRSAEVQRLRAYRQKRDERS